MAASGQKGMPASLPRTPGGSLIEKWVISCSASLRVRRTLKGLKEPPALLIVPAVNPGRNGGRPPEEQGPWPGPLVIAKLLVLGTEVAGADQGLNLETAP